jgi:hypothetical protein
MMDAPLAMPATAVAFEHCRAAAAAGSSLQGMSCHGQEYSRPLPLQHDVTVTDPSVWVVPATLALNDSTASSVLPPVSWTSSSVDGLTAAGSINPGSYVLCNTQQQQLQQQQQQCALPPAAGIVAAASASMGRLLLSTPMPTAAQLPVAVPETLQHQQQQQQPVLLAADHLQQQQHCS